MSENRHKFMFKSQIDAKHQAYIEKETTDVILSSVATLALTSSCALLWYAGINNISKDILDATVLIGSASFLTVADLKQICNFKEKIEKYANELKYYHHVRGIK